MPQHHNITRVKTNFHNKISSASQPKFRKVTKEESIFADLVSAILDKRDSGIALFWDKNEKRFLFWMEGLNKKELRAIYDFLKNKVEVK